MGQVIWSAKDHGTGMIKRKTPKKIDSLISGLLKKWQTKTDHKTIWLSSLWVAIVGEKIARHTRAHQLVQGKLIVLAENSTWMNELTFMKETIKIKAKSVFLQHQIEIDDVVFKIGK